MRKIWLGLLACFFLASASSCTRSNSNKGPSVLIVGNSLTYTNNLPAILTALAKANGKHIEVGMLVAGGATLTQHLSAGAVERALDDKQISIVVFQERGGVLNCYRWNDQFVTDCENSLKAHRAFASLAQNHNATAVLLGTYQSDERASVQLERNETDVATEAKFQAVVHISEDFLKGMELYPNAQWLDKDGMHPGDDLTMLMAIKLYRQAFNSWPALAPVTVNAPDFVPASRFVLTDSTNGFRGETSVIRTFDVNRIGVLIKIAKSVAAEKGRK